MGISIVKILNVNTIKKTFRLPGVLDLAGIAVLSIIATVLRAEAASQLMDYYQPTPIIGSLSATCWGAAQVGPRDQSNGLEDTTLAKYVYWDGSIIKGPDSTYHIYCSLWDQTNGHNGWMCCSKAVHATSKNLYGPYTQKGFAFSENNSAGHNVGILQLRPGDPCGKQYALTLSGGFGAGNGRMYGANSLDGPWTYIGGISTVSGTSMDISGNLQIILRPDGKYEAINNSGVTAISDNFLGPYKPQPTFYPGIRGIPNVGRIEDPTIWYSGGKYHWVCNQWDIVKAFHFTSLDGLTNWKLEPGYAYDASVGFVRYTDKDSTANRWVHYERPRAYLEDGHVVAFTFAAINVEKDQDKANDRNGSKIIVVPFDGEKFDSDSICVSFYPENNYGGIPVALKPGNYTTAQLTTAGIPNNSVSSIWVSGGLTIEIYDNDNFTGTKWTINANTANLGSLNCNDAMSSVKIINPAVSTNNAMKRSIAGVTDGQNVNTFTIYDLSGRTIENRKLCKTGIYLTKKVGNGVQKVYLTNRNVK
jgi:hypothetical protein